MCSLLLVSRTFNQIIRLPTTDTEIDEFTPKFFILTIRGKSAILSILRRGSYYNCCLRGTYVWAARTYRHPVTKKSLVPIQRRKSLRRRTCQWKTIHSWDAIIHDTGVLGWQFSFQTMCFDSYITSLYWTLWHSTFLFLVTLTAFSIRRSFVNAFLIDVVNCAGHRKLGISWISSFTRTGYRLLTGYFGVLSKLQYSRCVSRGRNWLEGTENRTIDLGIWLFSGSGQGVDECARVNGLRVSVDRIISCEHQPR
jgi:hypothetical protein